MTDEVICAVCEVQLSEIDAVTSDKASPKCNPETFAPEVARQETGQNIEGNKDDFVVAKTRNCMTLLWAKVQTAELAKSSANALTCSETWCPYQLGDLSNRHDPFHVDMLDDRTCSTSLHVRRRSRDGSRVDPWLFRRTCGELDEFSPTWSQKSKIKESKKKYQQINLFCRCCGECNQSILQTEKSVDKRLT